MRTKMLKKSIYFSICATIALCSAMAPGATFYSVSPLPGPAGSSSNVALSASSPFMAGYDSINGVATPVTWQSGQPTALAVPAGESGGALGININGDAVGTVQAVGDLYGQPALWHNGQLQILTTPAGVYGTANAINDSGIVVGYLADAQTNNLQAAMWDNGQLSVLESFPNVQATADSVNNSGQVVINVHGTSQVWSNSTFAPIPSAGGTAVFAHDINDKGAVVGELTITQGTSVSSGFLYTDGVTTLLPRLPDDMFTDARAINDSGVIVGDGTANDATYSLHALVWQDGQVYNLNDLIPANGGWNIIQAFGISNDGTIVGYGTLNGQESAVELTPTASSAAVPEPATAALLFLGTALLLRRPKNR